jgi:hypothetical protein
VPFGVSGVVADPGLSVLHDGMEASRDGAYCVSASLARQHVIKAPSVPVAVAAAGTSRTPPVSESVGATTGGLFVESRRVTDELDGPRE